MFQMIDDIALKGEYVKYPILPNKSTSEKRCLSCGTRNIKSGRRYCSKECRQHMNWVLSLSKGLLRAFNARYATFSYTSEYVILDILPVWSNGISRLMGRRNPDRKPAEDFKELILHWGKNGMSLLIEIILRVMLLSF